MGFRCGIVGMPNVGKSTLFNALTSANVLAANYPFATVDPNVGRVPVPDKRLDKLASLVQPKQIVPAYLDIVDIAGLVRGASEGQGLGNQFLGHIREVDAILHVVRCFEGEVTHVEGRVNPVADAELIDTELILADQDSAKKQRQKADRKAKGQDKEAMAEVAQLERIEAFLDTGVPLRRSPDKEMVALASQRGLLTAKPVLYVANVSESLIADENQPHVAALRKHAEADGAAVILVSAAIEAELSHMNAQERQEFLADLGLDASGLERMVLAGYRLLHLMTYFTAGPKEVRAWTIDEGTTAQKAAGKIHSDFERGFIAADIVAYDRYVEAGGWNEAKGKGWLQTVGRDHLMHDGDVVIFRFNV